MTCTTFETDARRAGDGEVVDEARPLGDPGDETIIDEDSDALLLVVGRVLLVGGDCCLADGGPRRFVPPCWVVSPP